jgi:hypothetical protein
MSADKTIQNKPLLIAVIVIALGVALSIASYVDTHGLNRETAKARAIPLMQAFCARECAAQGLSLQDLTGPSESARNAEHGNTKFDFTWTGHGKVLLVRIWDNGLTQQTLVQWQAPERLPVPH